MTREQAINSMISHGFTVEQAGEIIKAVTPQLSVPEVTALAEWTEKLTKASEDAYNKGYADGMKAQEPRKGHWIVLENWYDVGKRVECSACGQVFVTGDNVSRNFCANCGADMREGEE